VVNDVQDKPQLSVGDKVRIGIEDIAFGGDGVARWQDFVIFVPYVITGEEVEIEITEVRKRFGRARLLDVIKPSPARVKPKCRYFGVCGGCQYQHVDYNTQLAIKRKQISDLLQRLGGISNTSGELVSPIIPCPQTYGYRNRIMIRSQWDKFKQGLNIGFIRSDSRLVVDIEECPISEPAINEQIQNVRANPPPKGGLKVVLRVAPEGWEVPADSFFQNNFFMLPGLVETVGKCLADSGVRYLVDAYCGVGFFSIELAERIESYVGVEVEPRAIEAARRNAQRRGRNNGEFVQGRTEELLPKLLQRFPAEKTSLILDPPRTGCPPESLHLLRQYGPAQIIYVSCHPATLARDLNVLRAGDVFDLRTIVPLDMFPQTQHIECVADLRHRGSPLPLDIGGQQCPPQGQCS
jgi:tRNA/tmRNA/rRNA uracil-C5-methylase (TrmA/RlmC/RlmD family)